MALSVRWTPEAEASFDAVCVYLADAWGEGERRRFVRRTDALIEVIRRQPELFRSARHDRDLRVALVHPHTSMIYRTTGQAIIVLLFVDNRSDPANRTFD